jgi:CubicO group peptidase (beta-lactamase class C family)
MVDRHMSVSRRGFGAMALGGAGFAFLPGALDAELLASRSVIPVPPATPSRDGLQRATPESQGVSSERLLAFVDAVGAAGLELHGFMMMRHDKVVSEGWWWPYAPNRQHMLHSLTKSFNVTAVGMAMDEGRFGYDDKLVSFFKGQVPADASDNLKAITVRDLLDMQCGHDHETSGSAWRPLNTSWAAEFFKIPVPYRPGTKWVYTSAASYMLSGIVTKTTGLTSEAYLRPRFFEPLGITNYHWDVSPEGFSPGGNGLSCTLADALKLGALYAHRGVWKGRRLLSEAFVDAASRKQANGPYGYQFWTGPAGAYYGLGLFAQISLVLPEQDAVLAFFSAIDGSKRLLDIVWRHFPGVFVDAGPATPQTATLARRMRDLRLLPALAPTRSPRAARISGRTFRVEANDQGVSRLSFTIEGDRIAYRMADDRGEHGIVAGTGQWLEQDTTMTGHSIHHEYEPDRMRVVAGAVWKDADTLEMTWQFVESAFRDTVVCRFDGDRVTLDRHSNINFKGEPTVLPTLTATMA